MVVGDGTARPDTGHPGGAGAGFRPVIGCIYILILGFANR